MLAVGAMETWTWWPHLANFRWDVLIVVFSGSDSFSLIWSHGERETERDGGGGGDIHAEERQARLERELKCKSEESDEAHRSVPTSCLDPLESKLGFPRMSII